MNSEGLRGLYAGFKPSVSLDCTYSALQFAFYEKSRELVLRRKLSQSSNRTNSAGLVPVDFVCGAFSGGLAAWLTNPIDVVTNRMMLQRFLQNHLKQKLETSTGTELNSKKNPTNYFQTRFFGCLRIRTSHVFYTSATNCFVRIWRDEGLKGLWRGSSARMLSVVPMSALTFGVYEQTKRWLHLSDNALVDDYFS